MSIDLAGLQYSVKYCLLGEVLPARCEHHNPHAIAIMKHLPRALVCTVVGHLPREVSRFTYFIISHGARVFCKVVEVNHRRSPLIQGGLEIPIEVTVEMDVSEQNVLAIGKYKSLVDEHYEEPVDGKYADATEAILQALKSASDDEQPVQATCREGNSASRLHRIC